VSIKRNYFPFSVPVLFPILTFHWTATGSTILILGLVMMVIVVTIAAYRQIYTVSRKK